MTVTVTYDNLVTCVTYISHFVIYVTITYNITLYLLSESKIKKSKIKSKN